MVCNLSMKLQVNGLPTNCKTIQVMFGHLDRIIAVSWELIKEEMTMQELMT